MSKWWYLQMSNDSEMMMICTMILWWYLQCDDNDISLQMRIYLQNTDGNGMYNEVLQILWGEMKWKKKYMMSMYIKQNFWTLIPLPPLVAKRFLLMCFLWCQKTSGLKRICCKVGTPTPLLGAPSSREHKWLPMRLMGPLCSPQPSTGKLFWCLPVESWGVAYLPVCCPQELEWQLLKWTQWQGLQDLRLQVLQTLEETVGELGNWGLGRHGMVEVVKEEGRSTRWLPSRVHKNLLPQTPLWPPLISPTPLSLAAGPLLLVSLPPPSSCLHTGAVSNPTKKEEVASSNPHIKIVREEWVAIKKERKQGIERGRWNAKRQGNLLTSASSPWASPSGRAGWPPTSIQLCRISTSSSSLVIGLLSSSFPSLESSERESHEKKEEV